MVVQVERVDTLDLPFLWYIHQKSGLNEEILFLAHGFRLWWAGFVFLGRGEVQHRGRSMGRDGVEPLTSGEWEAGRGGRRGKSEKGRGHGGMKRERWREE